MILRSRFSARRARRGGFTLLEILLAALIAGLLLAALYAALYTTLLQTQTTRDAVEAEDLSRGVFNKLSIDPSAMARLTSWLHGWIVFRDHWLIGIGFNTWGYVAERYGWIRSFSATYGIDGGLFFVLVLTGVVGFALYAGMLWSVFRTALEIWRDRNRPAQARGLALGAAVTVPMIVVHSLFSNSLLLPFLMEPLWILWALPSVLQTDV